MRRSLIVVAALAASALVWTLLTAAGGSGDTLASKTADAGGVEVTVTPVQVNGDGAVFQVALNTHTVDLDLDAASAAALLVDATPWVPARWQGDEAGGHHRQGQLTFPAQGPAEGAVRLIIDGLPSPAIFEWQLGGP
jgi:hypothetical protein